ncbi:ankyrin repeat domain-containing protein 29-like [Saccostrea cucullata]|uniref:ankyrin repeat domain-containing protein 29-like n=1 Tax=Saccostrea cuccullata TaxID=36930 RepID=UPI002ED32B5F
MEITTLVFGADCPQKTIQNADSGFLRRQMKIEDDTEEEDRDPFTVYLPQEYIAIVNEEEHLTEAGMDTKGGERRDATIMSLLNNGADINLCMNNGTSPLNVACKNGHDSTVQLLLNNGAESNLCTNDGVTSLLEASCENGHDSPVQLLLNNGADINSCTNDGASPLYIACENGHNSTVQILLNNGADINLYTKDGVFFI